MEPVKKFKQWLHRTRVYIRHYFQNPNIMICWHHGHQLKFWAGPEIMDYGRRKVWIEKCSLCKLRVEKFQWKKLSNKSWTSEHIKIMSPQKPRSKK